MPTGKCNCVCRYCYFPEGIGQQRSELFVRIADSFTEHVNSSDFSQTRPQIRFTGGEPWLKQDLLPRITERFLGRVRDGWVVVNTNATILPEDRLKDFRGEQRLIHVVSLDGPEFLHDSRRRMADGRGSFREVIRGIKMLLDLDLPVFLNTVLDRESSKHLPELLRFISGELGLGELSVSLLHLDENPLSPGEKYALLENAYSEAANHSIRLGGHHRLLLGHWIPELRCAAGSTTALVDPAGMVHACQRFVGRVESDCPWTDSFDWNTFKSGQACGPVCGGADDYQIGEKLYSLYRNHYPDYLTQHCLDRNLFGALK